MTDSDLDKVAGQLRRAEQILDQVATYLGPAATGVEDEARRYIIPPSPLSMPAGIGWQVIKTRMDQVLQTYQTLRNRLGEVGAFVERRAAEERTRGKP